MLETGVRAVPQAPPDAIRVAVVDDDVLLAESLVLAWLREPDLEVVGVAHTGAEGLALVRATAPSVVLLDHVLPDMTGPDLAATLAAAGIACSVLIMSIAPTDEVFVAAIEAGASGVLSKADGIEAVALAVRRAAAGASLIPASMVARALARQRQQERRERERAGLLAELTARERQVLRLMGEGLDTRAMAGHLVLGETTVRTYVAAILSTLDAHTRLQAVVKAARLGLLD